MESTLKMKSALLLRKEKLKIRCCCCGLLFYSKARKYVDSSLVKEIPTAAGEVYNLALLPVYR